MLILEQAFGLDQLELIAKKLAELVNSHHLFTFEGDLGAGKTTLVKAFCEQLGVKDKVASPTYSLVNQYAGSMNGKQFPVYHIDLYRLDSAEEAYHAGIEEILQSREICLVEWPQRLGMIAEERRIAVRLAMSSSSMRQIWIDSHEN